MENSDIKDDGTKKRKSRSSMIVSLGEKRMERFKALADELEKSYSSVMQELVDEWMKKNSRKR